MAVIALWAPAAKKVEIILEGSGRRLPLKQAENGYHLTVTGDVRPGDRYQIMLDAERKLPDPASLFQPEGVFGPSVATDLQKYEWKAADWVNIPLEDYIMYELHIGTFTGAGTFAAAEARLDYLKELGITAVELMPVAQFAGSRGWGYDGVFPFAVQNSYGGPEGLMHFIDACHARGIAVILDVVYNHLGPEGNCLGEFGPYFTDAYRVAWGDAINFDGPGSDEVRNFFLENALMWLRDFRADALRIDASHDMKDWSPVHILKEMRQRVDELAEVKGAPSYLIVELNLNDPRYIDPYEKGGFGMDAQWLDEFHHALLVAATGRPIPYYADYNGISHLAKSYRDAYVYDGIFAPQRGKTFGWKAEDNPGRQFVVFCQNHDQVANEGQGKRNGSFFSDDMQKLMAGAIMVAPYLPLLFMGEEWSAGSPFYYFIDYGDQELMEVVARGRREDFGIDKDVPEPGSEIAFQQSKLRWEELQSDSGRQMSEWYRKLIRLRKRLAALRIPDRSAVETRLDEEARVLVLQRWQGEQRVCCFMNFSPRIREVELPAGYAWRKLLDSASVEPEPGRIQPESIIIYASGDV